MARTSCFKSCFSQATHTDNSPPFRLLDIESELLESGHQQNYIRRALRVYHNNYGHSYDSDILSEIIFRLKIKDAIKTQQHVGNMFHSRVSIYSILQALGFPNSLICRALAQYKRDNIGKPYKFDEIVKEILQLRTLRNNTHLIAIKSTNNKANSVVYTRNLSTNKLSRDMRRNSDDTIHIHSSCTTFNDTVRINISGTDQDSDDIDDILDSSALLEMAIDNFPRFEWNEAQRISPTSNECEHCLSNCHSFIRVNYILYWYQGWVYCGRKTCGFYTVINKYDYNNSKLLDDLQHLMCCHAFDDIYAKLQCRCHQIDCVMLKRNNCHRNNLYFDSNDDEETNAEQICDVLHCYFLHSYDVGMLFTIKEQNEIDKIKDVNTMNGNSLKIQAMKDILYTKQKRLRINIETGNKYKTDTKNANLTDYGVIHYEYFNAFDQYYISPLFDSLKSELLQHVSINQWNALNIRAINIQQKQYSRLLKASYSCNVDENTYKISNGSIISNYHIAALMIWSNFHEIQKKFYSTFICLSNRNNLSISNRQNLMQQHSKFANFGKILYEAVHIFGKSVAKTSRIYHCFTSLMDISSHLVSISWPISASSSLPIMLNEMNECNGFIVELNDKNNNTKLKYFDCCFVSNWCAQNELFMIGNEAFLQQMFEIDGMIQVRYDENIAVADYSNWLICWKIIIKFISGWSYNTMSCDEDILRNVPLILEQLQMLSKNRVNIKSYIICDAPNYMLNLMYKYATSVREIEIDWFYLNNYYYFLKSFLCFERMDFEFVDFSILLSIFPCTKKISINGGYHKHEQLKFNKVIIEYIYDYLFSNGYKRDKRNIQLQKIVICNLNTKGTPSLQQVCKMYRKKFKRIDWKFGVQVRNDTESLVFKYNQ